jgi:peptidoglycan/xylan/chitin deacetylase (PgdA/CDA1 family)
MFDVTLSFDNGPHPDATGQVLDCLAQRGLQATFFVVGRQLLEPSARRLVERAHAEGHWIGNHTFSHDVPLGCREDADGVERELERTQDLLGGLCHEDKWFRPFGGGGNLDRRLLNARCVEHLVQQRYSCVLWNAVPRDWEDPDGWPERALAQCAGQPASLLVLHDLPTGAMQHLDRFLGEVLARGGRFRQRFPESCLPIVRGEVLLPLAEYVARVKR